MEEYQWDCLLCAETCTDLVHSVVAAHEKSGQLTHWRVANQHENMMYLRLLSSKNVTIEWDNKVNRFPICVRRALE